MLKFQQDPPAPEVPGLPLTPWGLYQAAPMAIPFFIKNTGRQEIAQGAGVISIGLTGLKIGDIIRNPRTGKTSTIIAITGTLAQLSEDLGLGPGDSYQVVQDYPEAGAGEQYLVALRSYLWLYPLERMITNIAPAGSVTGTTDAIRAIAHQIEPYTIALAAQTLASRASLTGRPPTQLELGASLQDAAARIITSNLELLLSTTLNDNALHLRPFLPERRVSAYQAGLVSLYNRARTYEDFYKGLGPLQQALFGENPIADIYRGLSGASEVSSLALAQGNIGESVPIAMAAFRPAFTMPRYIDGTSHTEWRESVNRWRQFATETILPYLQSYGGGFGKVDWNSVWNEIMGRINQGENIIDYLVGDQSAFLGFTMVGLRDKLLELERRFRGG